MPSAHSNVKVSSPGARRLAAIAAAVLACVLSGCVATHPQAPASAPATPVPRAVANSLAAQYPGDRGMSRDPAIVFYEDFSAGSLGALVTRYTEVRNSAGIQLAADHPAGSPSRFAVQLTAGGDHAATHLYKSFPAGYDELYLRYYVRYAGAGPWHHSGVWFGGYSPPLPYPYPRAGERPAGDDLFSIALEPIGAGSDPSMDLYAYWMGMRSWKAVPSGTRDYFGNTLLHRSQLRVRTDTWDCYEIHLKLNPDPATGAGAVLEVWENDALVRRFDNHGPLGYLLRDKFCAQDTDDPACTAYRPARADLRPLEQRWRSAAALRINYLWLENFNDAAAVSSLRLADVVLATRRIGCLAAPGGANSQ